MNKNFVIDTPPFEWQEVSLKGDKKYFISGYISTIDADDYNEVVTMQAQEKLLKACQERIQSEAFITLDVEHEDFQKNGQVLRKPEPRRIPVAKIVEAELKERGVWVKAEINKNSDRFDTVWNSIKEGYLHSFSIAFAPLKTVTQRVNGVIQRFIEDLNLSNITLTGNPVNRNATFTVALKAKLDEEGKMTEEKPQEQPVETQEQVTQEQPVETQEQPVETQEQETEKVLTLNDLIENAKALEKERTLFEAEKAAFEKARAEPKVEKKEVADLVAQIKSKDDEIAQLKAKLNSPILKSKIQTSEEKKAELKSFDKVRTPLEQI